MTLEGLLYKPYNNLSPLISLLGQSNVAARYISVGGNYAKCPVYQTLNKKNPGRPVYQLPVYQSKGQPTNFSNEIQLETPKARTSRIAQEDQPTYQGLLNIKNSEFMSMIIASCVSCHWFSINLDCQENIVIWIIKLCHINLSSMSIWNKWPNNHQLFLICKHVTRRPCWWSIQYNVLFFQRIYMEIFVSRGENRLCSWSPRWSTWHCVQTSNCIY